MLRNAIIEIQHKYGEYDRWLETWKYTVEAEKKIVDEILALFANSKQSAGEPIYSRDEYLKAARILSVRKPCYCENCVGENDMSFEEDVPEDCDCKCCKPELWYLDKDRGYTWFKKSTLMQRTGDEVI